MAVNLVFKRPRYAGGPVDLVFGSTSTPVLPDPAIAHATVVFGGIAVSGSVVYDNRVTRYVGHPVATAHQPAAPLRTSVASAWSRTGRLRNTTAVAWGNAAAVEALVGVRWGVNQRRSQSVSSAWQLAGALERSTVSSWEAAARRRAEVASLWQLAEGVGASASEHWQSINRLRRVAASAWQAAGPVERTWQDVHGRAERVHASTSALWELARRAPQGRTVRPLPPVAPLRVPSTHLVFSCPRWLGGPVHLVFGHVCMPAATAAVFVPVRSFYMTQNHVTITRVSSGAFFEASRFDLRIDADSWTFSWSASLHSSARTLLARSVAGERIEVECNVNGVLLRLVVESIGRDKSFPEGRVMVRGRGISAELGDADLTFEAPAVRTAQQLMEDVLTVNGVPIGWSVDWQITDWLVPADAWMFKGSHMSALQDIAGAAGAYLQPHATGKVIRVLPRYPVAPWAWATGLTPDIELPGAVVSVENVEEVIKPAYDRVFVGGVGKGVFGPVTRTGFAGDQVAPQVSHPLITAPEVHQQRGLAVLSDTGVQERVSLRTMVLSETGIILPGKALRYVGDDGPRLGIVRGTQVQMSQWPVMHQTLELETHVE